MSELPLWFQLMLGLMAVVSSFLTGAWAIVKYISKRWTDDISNALSRGKDMVDVVDDKQERHEKYTTQQFEAIDYRVQEHDKQIRILQSQQVAKDTVEEMLDSRVRPLENSLDKVEETMEREFKEIKDSQTLNDMNLQNVLVALSRLEGKLEGSGVIRGGRSD